MKSLGFSFLEINHKQKSLVVSQTIFEVWLLEAKNRTFKFIFIKNNVLHSLFDDLFSNSIGGLIRFDCYSFEATTFLPATFLPTWHKTLLWNSTTGTGLCLQWTKLKLKCHLKFSPCPLVYCVPRFLILLIQNSCKPSMLQNKQFFFETPYLALVTMNWNLGHLECEFHFVTAI